MFVYEKSCMYECCENFEIFFNQKIEIRKIENRFLILILIMKQFLQFEKFLIHIFTLTHIHIFQRHKRTLVSL